MNPFKVPEFKLSEKSFLATENLRDSVMYKYIGYYYKRSCSLANMDISFEKWNGGGSDFGNSLKTVRILNSSFVLVVVDSDKHCPKDKVGRTAKGIKFVGHGRFNADYHILENVMEVENLIPYQIIQRKNTDIIKLKGYDLSYFDFKKGLTHSILYDKDARDFWKQNFAGLGLDWKKIEKLACEKDYSGYCACFRNEKPLVVGFGSSLLDSVLQEDGWDFVKEGDLTKAQQEEWRIVGKKIFSWTCCSQKKL